MAKENPLHLNPNTEADFEYLFKTYFRELHAYSYSLLKDWDAGEEIVQALFLKLWEKNDWTNINTSIKSYLYKCVYHDSLNFMRREKTHLRYQTLTAHTLENETDDASNKLKLSEVEHHLHLALNQLPEKCRAIFHMSRFEQLKYQEIANHLEISIKTVETHMVKALRILRKEMHEFLPLMALILINMFMS
jgi:RNA polymerase sigma-70 factor (ECF subfamily)